MGRESRETEVEEGGRESGEGERMVERRGIIGDPIGRHEIRIEGGREHFLIKVYEGECEYSPFSVIENGLMKLFSEFFLKNHKKHKQNKFEVFDGISKQQQNPQFFHFHFLSLFSSLI